MASSQDSIYVDMPFDTPYGTARTAFVPQSLDAHRNVDALATMPDCALPYHASSLTENQPEDGQGLYR
jgi:hypothetical protein